MKWNMLIGSLVLGFGLCTQSFGFDLLDRMLGVNSGCGCQSQCGATACCEQPTCCQPAPQCGCEAACEPSCNPCRRGLLDHLLTPRCKPACESSCCEQVAPSCGCEVQSSCCAAAPCEQSCCKSRRIGLLDRLFSCNRGCKPSCCEAVSSCGCGGGVSAPAGPAAGGDMAPMPPAPVVDPSAYVPSQRRVVRASHNLVR